jgi:cytochrome c oxidase subunit II
VLGGVVWSSTLGRNRETNLHKLAARERTWFGIVVVLLVGLLFATIFFTPYGRSAGGNAQSFDVRSRQFVFLMPGKRLKAGVPVRFRLTSADVNHEFGVYNAKNVLLFQVQVMPGKTSEYVYTFKKAGVYHALCLEYCGVNHDQMGGQFRVTR